MPRRNRQPLDPLQQVLQRVQRRYANSPLSPIGQKLECLIKGTQEAILAGSAKPEQATRVADHVNQCMEILPHSFGQRFYFDATMVKALAEEWSQGPIQLSNMIIPCHGDDWGYKSFDIWGESGDNSPWVGVVFFPGGDNLDDIDLLSYPWLCHEVGHNILSRNHSVFSKNFETRLDKIAKALRLLRIADRGSLQDKSQRVIDDILHMWRPTPNSDSWVHEMTIDILALWTCGPAYLAAFQDVVENPDINPWKINQNHPPYELRVSTLAGVGERLGWTDQTGRLTQIMADWRKSRWRSQRTNTYLALANPDIVHACVDCALDACEKFALPRCTPERVSQIQGMLQQEEIPDFGSELLVAAWTVCEQHGDAQYEKWEKETVHKLLDFIIQ